MRLPNGRGSVSAAVVDVLRRAPGHRPLPRFSAVDPIRALRDEDL
jgi:hypothetical protein